jgi:hypothetical protein
MRAIFISYRRDDSEGQAGRLFDDLVVQFGADSVFMDVAGLQLGRDFRRAIDEQIASCGVLLSVIGKNWLTAKNDSGERRLDDPSDFVRLETASALKRDIPVIPVLVGGAGMPRAEDLPDGLKELAFRNGVELTHARWDSDVQLLIKALQPYVQTKPKPTEPVLQSAASAPQRSRMFYPLIIFGGLVGLLVLAFAGYLLVQNFSRQRTGEVTNENSNRNENRVATPSPSAKPTRTASTEPSREVIPAISAPVLLSPSDGTRFDHFPRTVTLAWEKVPGASGYKVEIQYQGGGWNPLGQVKTTAATTHTFGFVGAQPGRWRVWAVDAEGREGPKSVWSGFYFTQ